MQVLTFSASSEDHQLITELWELGTIGVLEDAGSLQAYFPESIELHCMLTRYPAARLSKLAHENASSAPLPPHDPVFIGSRFVVLDPSTKLHHTISDRSVLVVRSFDAFGSGRHESTQLVIEALEQLNLSGATVLDVGCGTAITSEAARLLGAQTVVACDIHAGAVEQARTNFPAVHLLQGSVDALASQSIDVVIANISARIIDRLSGELARVTKPRGIVILSGFTADCLPASVRPDSISEKSDWICWKTAPENFWQTAKNQSIQPFQSVWW